VPSRQTSPEKRQRITGTSSKAQPSAVADTGGKPAKGKTTQRLPSRDKSSARPNSLAFGKSTYRRAVSNTGTKVANIARHFERISKDSERANRRYAVIRGRRARPVASARPKVQVFDSIQDVMRNETESSDSSSDADDEDDDDDDEPQGPPHGPASESDPATEPATEPTTEPQPIRQASADISPPERSSDSAQEQVLVVPQPRPGFMTPSSGSLGQSPIQSVPPSPGLPTLPVNSPALTPPEGWGPSVQERHSFMKAISGIWSQQLYPVTISKGLADSYEDTSADPVHIHRDSPIALRTDEPTSIIAVALRYDYVIH
jgi:1-phosphatidylinositol-3-phosphate 5-kinase